MDSPSTARKLPAPACRALAAAIAVMAAIAGTSDALAAAAVTSSQPPSPAVTARVSTVASGSARSVGEPTVAKDRGVSAVAATDFGPTGARVRVWAKRARSPSWASAGVLLPAGFGTSYDASAAAFPGGPLLVVAGTAPPGERCIANSSVAIANVSARGRLGAARLVSDQRGTGSFDDRPVVATGPGGRVWVAWSQGPDQDACQNVGTGDRLVVAASSDSGRSFGEPVVMPAAGGHSAFGARLAPLSGGRVAVSWTETMSNGTEAVLVSVLGPGARMTRPQAVLAGDPMPLVLPGASFYDFPAGDISALPGGDLVVAAPLWRSGRGVIEVAAGRPGAPWRTAVVRPPRGADLLLPAVATAEPLQARLVCAVHRRAGDRLGYAWADLSVASRGSAVSASRLTRLTPAPSGPGFFEIGEELSLARTPSTLVTALVVAGRKGAAVRTESWTVPRPAVSSAPPSPRPASSAAGQAATAAGSRWNGAAWAAAAVIGAVVLVLLATWARVRRNRLSDPYR